MRKFLSLIVILMLAFNVKAQYVTITKASDFTFSDNGTEKTLFQILDGGQHALLYFLNYKASNTDTYATIVNGVYNSFGKNKNDVYVIGIDPANESLLLNNWAASLEIEYPLVAQDQGAYDISITYAGNAWGVSSPTLVLIAPDHEIILKEIWPITSADQVVGIINENLVTGDDNTGDDDGDDTDNPDEGDDNPSTPVELAVPQNLVATATATTIVLTWEAVDGATRYNIYEGTALLDEVTETTYTIENLAEGRYCYKVSALEDMGYESDAAEACATVGEDPEDGGDDNTGDEGDDEGDDPNNPGEGGDDNTGDEGDDEGDDNPSTPIELAAPANVVATATSETTIVLTWDAVEGATKYNIYTPASFDSDVLGITDTTYTFENLAEGRYCFKVSACEDLGYESNAAEACAIVGEEPGDGGEDPETPVDPEEPGDNPSDPFNPAMPTNIVATVTETTITLTWDAVEGATKYNIYTPTSFDSNVLGITETTYTFENLITGVEYCFDISAVSATGESDFAKVCATPGDEPTEPGDEPEEPVAPVVVADTVTETTVVLTWNAVENATSYNVYMDSVLVANVTDTTYTVDSLTAETTYSFTVTALADTLESEFSNAVTVTTLKVEGIVENTIAFNIYPNPVNDKLYIEAEVEVENIIVYDIFGRHQVTETPSRQGNLTIDVSNLNSGIYFVKVVTENGEVVKRIVKK